MIVPLMRKEDIVVGCCGFPVGLERYAKVLNAVETQQTFYRLVPERNAETWRRKADAINPSFEFSVKGNQFITHDPGGRTYLRAGVKIPEEKAGNYGYFRPTEEVTGAWEHTMKIARIVRARCIILQSPPSFGESAENLKNLMTFFDRMEKGFLIFWEPRGKWKEQTLREVCKRCDIYHCVDPLIRRPVTEDYFYFRLHGAQGGRMYRYTYTDNDLENLVSMIKGLEGKRVYVFFNNMSMFSDAQRFLKWIQ